MEAIPGTAPSGSADELLYRIVTRVAAAEGCGPLELPPLYDTFDPEMLVGLSVESDGTEFSFSYLDYEVVVTSDGDVRLAQT